jgi:hypothetical protein
VKTFGLDDKKMCGNRVNFQEIRNRIRKINLKLNITKTNNVLRM